jgi:hypothetical protein
MYSSPLSTEKRSGQCSDGNRGNRQQLLEEGSNSSRNEKKKKKRRRRRNWGEEISFRIPPRPDYSTAARRLGWRLLHCMANFL